MIVVDITLISARTGKTARLGRLHISNDGTGGKTRGNYNVEAFKSLMGRPRRARVENYPRKAVSVFNLVRRAIEAAGYTK